MDFGGNERQLESRLILTRIVADFEELDRVIEAAVSQLKNNQGSVEEIKALLRAREAARKGAALAAGRLEYG